MRKKMKPAKFQGWLKGLLGICFMLAACLAINRDVEAYTAHSVDEAINWCYSKVGSSIDMDGYPSGQPYQCVDLIKAYYQYLGVSPVSGNGEDYAWNSLPTGWTRVQGGTPQRGDILVYAESSSNPYGHVAIFESTRSTFHQNVDGAYVSRITYCNYNGFTNPYWGYIRPDFVSNGVLDINGLLDGATSGDLGSCGTCDVYINESKVADDAADYCSELVTGTTWRIDDIKEKDGYSYDGLASGARSGTIANGVTTDVRLKFNSCKLDVNGILDGKEAGGLGEYGTFDLYINGQRVVTGGNDYYNRVTKGASYKITNIRANDGYGCSYTGTETIEGTIKSGTTVVKLTFHTVIIPEADWKESDFLPGNITEDTCDIEYNNIYEKTQSTSPGSGWTNAGVVKDEWQNSGNPYVRYEFLSTSDSRVLVSSVYYHFCGPNAGNEGNYELSGNFVHYDYVPNNRITNVTQLGVDNGHPYFFVYIDGSSDPLYCNSSITCDGSYGTHGNRCRAWYVENTYQDRVRVTLYKFTKESGWQTKKDSSATKVKYRFRLKDSENPVITATEVTGIAQNGYKISCTATDNIGITKAVFVSWTDSETENSAYAQEVIPDEAATETELSAFIDVSSHGNEKDTWYHTKIYVYDKVGNVSEYEADDSSSAYIPTVSHSARQLNLPTALKEIEESAFEGSISFGEAILPDGVEKIGSRAFADCSRLLLVYMPDSVTQIATDAFDESSNVVLQCESNNYAAAFARENGLPYITE